MTTPEIATSVRENPPGRETLEARIAMLRAEIAAATESHVKAALHHEIGALAEKHLANDAAAVKEYLTAFNLDASFRPPLLALVRIFERRRSFVNLGRLYEAAAKCAPHEGDESSALVDRAVLLSDQLGKPAEATAFFEAAVQKDPSSLSAALMLEQHARALAESETVMRVVASRADHTRDPVLRSLLYTELAFEHAARGELDKAFEVVRKAVSMPAGRFRVLEQMERLARKHDRTEDLVPALEGRALLYLAAARGEDHGQGSGAFSVQRFADEARATMTAAALLHEAARLRLHRHGDARGAASTLAQAVAIRPDDIFLRQERMLACELAGDGAAAADEARILIERGVSGRVASSLHFRTAELALANEDLGGAATALTAAVNADPGAASAEAMLEDLLLDAGRHAERVALLEEQGNRTESPAEARVRAYFRAAQIAAEDLHDFPRAQALYERAAALTDDKVPILRELYGAAMRHGMLEVARDTLRVLRLLPVDETERSAFWYELEQTLRALGDVENADAVLMEAVDVEACAGWAPNLARVSAARAGNLELLSRAHRALAKAATEDETAAAHLCAAARAELHHGEEERAMATLREALRRAPAHRYAVALLEEILISRGEAQEAVNLLREAAEALAGAKAAEESLLLAGAAAEASGDMALAAKTYEQAVDQDPTSLAPLLALRRLAERTRDTPMLLRAREGLSAREISLGTPGRAALELGEQYDLVVNKPEIAEDAYRAALASDAVGIQAATAIALLPGKDVDASLRIEALTKLADASVGPSRAAFLRALVIEALYRDEDLPAVEAAAPRIAEIAPNDALVAFGRIRAAGADGTRLEERAAAWVELASAAQVPEVAAELLLTGLRAKVVAQGAEAVDDAFLLAQEISASAPDAAASGVALDESLAAGDDPEARVEALSARLLHAGRAGEGALRAAVGRALLSAARTEEAVRTLRAVVDREPDDLASWESLRVAAREERDFRSVVRACDALAKHAEGELRAMLLEEAAQVLMDELGDDEGAEERLRPCVEIDVTRPIAFYRLQDILTEKNDTAELIALVSKRIEAFDDPEELEKLFYQQARLLRSQGDREGALAALDNLMMLEGEHIGGLALKVEIHVSLEQWTEAVETLRTLTEAHVPVAQKRLAHLGASDFLEKRLDDPKGALAELEKVVALGQGDAALFVRMAGVAERAELFEEAVTARARAAEVTTGVERATHHRRAGELLRNKMRDLAGAKTAFERALAAWPTDLQSFESLGALAVDPVEREDLSRGFEAAVRLELPDKLTDGDTLRKLLYAAELRNDRDLALRVLSAIRALGLAAPGDEDELEALERRAATRPAAQLVGREKLRASGDGGRPAELARLVWESVAEMDRLEPASYGAQKSHLVSPKQPLPLRDELAAWITAFGSEMGDLYVGGADPSNVAAMPGKKAPTWVVGTSVPSPMSPSHRFLVGQLAFALTDGTLPFVLRTPQDAATVLFAAASAAETPLPAAGARSGLPELTQALEKKMPRRVRKAIPEITQAMDDGGAAIEGYCRAALRSALRAAMLAAGDVGVALRAVLGGAVDPEAVLSHGDARDLLSFWLSTAAHEVRRELGLAL